jgi:DME family drug/metabolite transporter
VATLVLAEPVVATLLGVLVLGERLGPVGWLGWLLVIAGLALQGVDSARRHVAPDLPPELPA